MDSIKAIETINTFQGEGINSGQRMLLIRFKYCNKNCPYCDTKIKMMNSIEASYSLEELQNFIDEKNTGILVTGGEPTIKQHFDDTVKLLNHLKYPIANVESNGHKLIELINETYKNNIVYVYSPKIFTKTELHDELAKSKVLSNCGNVVFKIVYQYNDLIKDYLTSLSILDVHSRVFLMPEGKTKEEIFKNASAVFDACEKYRFNFSSREHVIYNFI